MYIKIDYLNFLLLGILLLEPRLTNQLVTRLLQALINQLVISPLLNQQPQRMVGHLGIRPLLHPIQGIRQTAVQAAIQQHLPLSIRDTVSSPRVAAIHRPAVDQVTNNHKDMTRAEDISPVARAAMVVAKAAVEVTKVVGIKVVDVVVVGVVDMDSRVLPTDKAVVVMEAVEEGRFRFSSYHLIVVILFGMWKCHWMIMYMLLKILMFTLQNLQLF